MKAQTGALEKLKDAVENIALSIKHFVEGNIVRIVTQNITAAKTVSFIHNNIPCILFFIIILMM